MHDRAAAAPPRPTGPAAPDPTLGGRAERWLAQALIVAGLMLRALLVLHHRVNSDEPQHLHVAWAWAHGLLPYRDVFDNHTPLFGLLMAPLLALAGERADIVPLMRLAMLPLVAGGLVATWYMARRLFSERVAWWAVALAAVNPEFVRASVEYRSDQLWWPLWLGALAWLVCGRPGRARALGAGFLLGATVATSMKTSLLAATLLVAGLVTLVPLARRHALPAPRRALALAALVVLGALALPLAAAFYFAARGAWTPMLYGVVWHNLVPQLGMWRNGPFRPLLLLVAVPALLLIGRALMRHAPDPRTGALRAALFMGTGLAHACFEALWPLITRQDLLPLVPSYAIFAAALLVALAAHAARGARPARAVAGLLAALPALAVVAEMALAVAAEPPWRDATLEQRALLEQVMRLTRPDDVVMDAKGETIFRRRPYFLGVETITEERFRLRIIPDDIAAHMIAARTAVCVRQGAVRFPPGASTFMDTAYVLVDPVVRVLGTVLEPASDGGRGRRRFYLTIPQRYALITADGPANGVLDGTPYAGPRELAAGPHVYDPAAGEGRVAVLWADAVARGAMPLALRPAAPAPAGPRSASPDTVQVAPTDRLMVIAPHPDDESLACGGLIQEALARGAALRVVYATDGDLNPWSQLVHEHRWPRTFADRRRWGALRRAEAVAALHELGAAPAVARWLGLPDQGLTDLLVAGDPRAVDALAKQLREWRPTVIAAPSLLDVHPDHNAIAVDLALALARPGVGDCGVRVLAYRVHEAAGAATPRRFVALDGSQMERKRLAIERHRTQLHWHPREMFEFARPREGYDADDDAFARQPHLVRAAEVRGGRLVVTFARGHAPAVGPLVLHAVLQGTGGEAARVSLALPDRPGTLPARERVSGRALAPARLERAAGAWRLTLPLDGLVLPRLAFVKLERPRERRLGFFDESGWRPVRMPRPGGAR